MSLLNPFDNTAFDLVELTKAINLLPNNYGRVRELGIFPGKGVTSRTVMVEERNGVLNLLLTQPVGAPGTVNTMGKRKVRSFRIPHIPHDDFIEPSEYDGVRAFGSESQVATLAEIMNDHLQVMRNKHAITLEHLRIGALKGQILDADGSVLFDLFDEFEIDGATVYFDLETETTDMRGRCMEVVRHIEDNLKGEVMTGVRALCSPEFFDLLVAHPEVKEAFKYQESQFLRDDIRKGFSFGGITWEEYRGQADDADGTVRRFIGAGECHFYPEGTLGTFETVFAPADFLETVNTKGLEVYAKQEARKFNRGVDIHTQSNPLPICYRPGVLVKGTAEGPPAG